MRNRSVYFASFLLLASVCAWPAAHAHEVHLFAARENGTIHGSVRYADGPARGLTISIYGPDGALLDTVVSDDSGEFVWTPLSRIELRFVAESEDGHLAEFVVTASEVMETYPSPAPTAAVQPGELEHIVENAVSRQVRPLREQLDRNETRTRLRDVLGGIGYILGLAGLYVLVTRRPKRAGD